MDELTKSYLPWTWYPSLLFLPKTRSNDPHSSPYELRCILHYYKYAIIFYNLINMFWVFLMVV